MIYAIQVLLRGVWVNVTRSSGEEYLYEDLTMALRGARLVDAPRSRMRVLCVSTGEVVES